MKKLLFASLAALPIFAFVGPTMGKPHERYHVDKYWCQQNWEKCKKFKEEELKLREKHIAKDRECLQKAKDFWSFEECKAQVKAQMKRERWELRQRFLEEAR
ncbi:MAG: hypothetical protein ACK4MW_05225 [Aquificaceae bacterium]